ncbi:MAG: ATP-binding protein, partial [Actinomycetota bacterium]
MFQRFFQGDIQPSGRKGAGVGLSVVQFYVELHGGWM